MPKSGGRPVYSLLYRFLSLAKGAFRLQSGTDGLHAFLAYLKALLLDHFWQVQVSVVDGARVHTTRGVIEAPSQLLFAAGFSPFSVGPAVININFILSDVYP
jgi:hypothetical protein